jgi:fructokinase
MSRRVLSTGLAALDIIVESGRVWHRTGGTAANVAANLAFLGWRSIFAGVVGSDGPGRRVKRDLRLSGVQTRHLMLSPEANTPIVVQEILPSGHRFRFECPECGRRFPRYQPLAEEDAVEVFAAEQQISVFFFDRCNPGSLALADAYKQAGGLIVFEPSVAGRPRDFARALETAHVLKYGRSREPAFAGSLAQSHPSQLRIVTEGKHGVRFRIGRGGWRRLRAFPVEVVDTAGAGDWTTSGFLSRLAAAETQALCDRVEDVELVADALLFGQALGATSCAFKGARGLASLGRRAVLARVSRLLNSKDIVNTRLPVTRQSKWRGSGCRACLMPASA